MRGGAGRVEGRSAGPVVSALLAAVPLAFIGIVAYGVVALRYPYCLDYGEGPMLDRARLLALGTNVYRPDLSHYPYVAGDYPPVYVAVLAVCARVFGLSYAAGRMISLGAGLASAALVFLLLVHATGDRIAAALGSATFVASPYVLQWSALARVDVLGLAFALAGLWVAAVRPRAPAAAVGAAVLMIAAIFTRQTYAFAPAGAAAAWFGLHGRRQAMRFVGVTVAGTLVAFAALEAATQGGFFFHIVVAHVTAFTLGRVALFLGHLVRSSPILIVFAVVEIRRVIAERDRRAMLPVLYALLAFVAAFAVGKAGSNFNYLIECMAGLSLMAGVAVARVRRPDGAPAGRLLVPALLGLQLLWLFTYDADAFRALAGLMRGRTELARLEDLIRAEPGEVLADAQLGSVVLTGHAVPVYPWEFTRLAHERRWDQEPFVHDLRAGRFGLLALAGGPPAVWTEEMWAAIQEAYRPTDVVAGNTIYRPRGG